jgi:hypothetical protein
VISTMAIDRDQLLAQLDDIKSRTRSSIEVTTRLVDQSFLRFKASHRTLYAVHQSQELLDRLLQASDSGKVCRELPGKPVLAKKRPVAFNSGINAENITCGHCEGILLNKRAYRVWTEEYGLILLDMIVCYACKLEAEKLGLNTDEVKTSAAHRRCAPNNRSQLLDNVTAAQIESLS